MANVPPLVYRQVRMLAEAALGAPTGTSTFWFSPGEMNGPVPIAPGGSPPEEGILVPIRNQTRIVPLATVLLEPAGLAGAGVNAAALPRNGATVSADAAFWSDSAVQKFVQPYYTSVMGYEASVRLAQLQAAWNGRVPGVDVYALLHVAQTSQGGADPTSMEPLWVVFVENNTPRALPLVEFIDAFQPPAPDPLPLPAPVSYTPPAPPFSPHLPKYGELRAMAEWSASIDTAEFTWFSWQPAERTFFPPGAIPAGAITIPVNNPNVHQRPRPLHDVLVGLKDGNLTLLSETMSFWKDVPEPIGRYYRPDAFFWSTGAVEQFLLPYYASVDGFGGLGDLQSIHTVWEDQLRGTGGWPGSDGEVLPATGELLGLVHIPRSLWVSDETAAAGELFFLHAGQDGKPVSIPAHTVTGGRKREAVEA